MKCSSCISSVLEKTKIIKKVLFEECMEDKFFFVRFFQLGYFLTMDD